MQAPGDFSEDIQKQPATSKTSGEIGLLEENIAAGESGVLESRPLSRQTAGESAVPSSGWHEWWAALRCILPIYIATHLALLILTYCSALFTIGNFSYRTLPVSNLWMAWFRWDSGHYTAIATNGYDAAWRTAFFPSFPLLEHLLSFVTHDPFVAGLIISNVAGLFMLAVFYRLVLEDFDRTTAWNAVLYLAVFPTAFFFAAAYTESLFLLCALLSFYYMRRGSWWLAGVFGLLASLTRSVGICLLLPFCYEYLRQHDFSLKRLRFDALTGVGIPAGIGIFALYCYYRFHDLLAFSHAQEVWNHSLHGPWHGLIDSALNILRHELFSFDGIHNMIDLSACLFILALIILMFVGPWKFPRTYLAYGLYAIVIYLFTLIFPIGGGDPLGSSSRYMLEVFPAFIVLAAIGKKPQANLYYLMLAVPLLAFMLLQFLTGRWII
ncbi:MAG: mannosyltransferase family protein [Ktedonobacteraceae bacterium]